MSDITPTIPANINYIDSGDYTTNAAPLDPQLERRFKADLVGFLAAISAMCQHQMARCSADGDSVGKATFETVRRHALRLNSTVERMRGN